jgi:hypothetical protein
LEAQLRASSLPARIASPKGGTRNKINIVVEAVTDKLTRFGPARRQPDCPTPGSRKNSTFL